MTESFLTRGFSSRSVAVVLLLMLSIVLGAILGYLGVAVPRGELGKVSRFISRHSFASKPPTAYAPAYVSAVLWDFRGMDTLFETSVVFVAVVLTIALMRSSTGLLIGSSSLVVKTTARIHIPIALAIAIALAFNGHVTPGGGFQGGAVAASAILIASLSGLGVARLGLQRLIIVRTLGLLAISILPLAPLIIGYLSGFEAYVFQHQGKPGAPLSMFYIVDGTRLSLSIPMYNTFELVAVAAGFSVALGMLLWGSDELWR